MFGAGKQVVGINVPEESMICPGRRYNNGVKLKRNENVRGGELKEV